MITLYGWGPMFDCPSPSNYVMKTDIQLQMLGLDFDRATADLDAVSKHKAPYVMDGGTLVQDSNFIRAHFERKLGRSLVTGLSDEDSVTSWALERMAEDHLATIMAMERWLKDDNFFKGPALFFSDVPEEARESVMQEVRDGMPAAWAGIPKPNACSWPRGTCRPSPSSWLARTICSAIRRRWQMPACRLY